MICAAGMSTNVLEPEGLSPAPRGESMMTSPDRGASRCIGTKALVVALLLAAWSVSEAAEAHRSYEELRRWIDERPEATPSFATNYVADIGDRRRIEPYLPISAWEYYFFDGLAMEITATAKYPLPPDWGRNVSSRGQLDDQGVLSGFNGGGFPFPAIDPKDERAAEKVIWNMLWRPGAEDHVMPMSSWARGPGGRLDRELEYVSVDARYARGGEPLVDGEEDVRTKGLMEFRSPRDLAGTKMLTKKHVDHYAEDDGWMYSPQQRKPRRLLASERTSEILGMDWTQEDLMGFGGKVYEHRWTYLGKRKILATMNVVDNPEIGGPDLWVPNYARWEIRDAHVLLVEPKNPNHPYSHKVLFIDDEHFWTLWMFAFDRPGESLLRLSHSFLKYSESYKASPSRQAPFMEQDYAQNLGNFVFLHVGETDINAQKQHATVTHCYVGRTKFSPGRAKQYFSLRNMVSGRR
jgi:hypothetical protein